MASRCRSKKSLNALTRSGMKTAADIALLQAAHFDAVLIGEGLHTSVELSELTWTRL